MTDLTQSFREARPVSLWRRVRLFQSRPAQLLVASGLSLGLWCAPAVEIRWAFSSNRLYLTGPGSATLSDIAALVQGPLGQVAPGVWHLRSNLIIERGAQLELHGTSIGGDVRELRLQSNNATNAGSFVFISADQGSLSIRSTTITSWDDAADGPDTEYQAYGRAFLRVRSSLAADGTTPLESRMDIVDSDVSYLGYDEAEAYGMSWKVIGAHPDPTRSIYDLVNVYGEILNSRLHHNYFGVYAYGFFGGHWAQNEVDHNVGYGFDAHDDSDQLTLEDNHVHDNGWDGIIASLRCDRLSIRGNVSRANGQNGIILHRSSSDCLVENNQCLDNGTSGIVLAGDSRCLVRSNLLARNREAGLRLNLGSADNLIERNLCVSNTGYGLLLYKGSDLPEPGDDGRPKRNRFAANRVENNGQDSIHLSDSDDNTFATNVFRGNGDRIWLERGLRNRLDGNDLTEGTTVRTLGSPSEAPVTYLTNQPAVRVQVDQYSSTAFADGMGRVFDPEETAVATSINASGSSLRLTAADIGTTSTVLARSLWARVTQGTARINPTLWTNAAGFPRQWSAQAGSGTQNLTFTLGDLTASASYQVRKAGAVLRTLNSDAAGRLTFSDVAGTTNEVRYLVEPELQVFLERHTNGVVVSCSGGRLQRATRLSPPDWQDVPTTNNQSSIHLSPAEPMEFFRSKRL